jgi:hypothetical protein
MTAGLDEETIEAGYSRLEEDKRYYSEAHIMELGSFIAFHYGMQVFMRTLGAAPLRPS